MRIAFSGLEFPIDVESGYPTVLQVENQALFARICSSLREGEGRYACEPYTLWEGEDELKPSAALLFVDTPFDLPWSDKSLMGEVSKRFEKLFLEDEDLRGEIDKAAEGIASKFLTLGMSMNADYGFGIEWDLQKFVKAFGFGVDRTAQNSVFDSLIDFMSLALDAGCKKTLVFVNLKSFLTKNEVSELYRHAFFSKLRVLLLENRHDEMEYEYESKRTIDLQFLEY